MTLPPAPPPLPGLAGEPMVFTYPGGGRRCELGHGRAGLAVSGTAAQEQPKVCASPSRLPFMTGPPWAIPILCVC